MNRLNSNKRFYFTACRLIFLLSAILFAVNVFGQDEDVIRIDTELVTFDVTVTDASGKLVRGLTEKDFRIYEDDAERPVEFFEKAQKANGLRPIAVVFALDVSGSMTVEELEKLRGAMRVFIDRLANKEASFALMAFGMNVKTLQGFTNDRQKLERGFEKLFRDSQGLSTHTYDAVDDAVRLLDRKAPRSRGQIPVKKSVIVITDGFPVGDTVAPSLVIERAQASDVSIFTVTLPSFSKISMSKTRSPLPTPLDVSGLAEKTGGRNLYATDRDFEPLFRALAVDVATSYLLAFYPAEGKRSDGRFHRVRIEPRNPEHKIKQTREGYQAETK